MEIKESLRILKTVSTEISPALGKLAQVFAEAEQISSTVKALRAEKTELDRQVASNRDAIDVLIKEKRDAQKATQTATTNQKEKLGDLHAEFELAKAVLMGEIADLKSGRADAVAKAKKSMATFGV